VQKPFAALWRPPVSSTVIQAALDSPARKALFETYTSNFIFSPARSSLAGAMAAWVPHAFWQSFFIVYHPLLASFWGPIVGPLVAVVSFVCSVGNIPLAAVLWNGGISFGGVIASPSSCSPHCLFGAF
jgi:hypothetical protein